MQDQLLELSDLSKGAVRSLLRWAVPKELLEDFHPFANLVRIEKHPKIDLGFVYTKLRYNPKTQDKNPTLMQPTTGANMLVILSLVRSPLQSSGLLIEASNIWRVFAGQLLGLRLLKPRERRSPKAIHRVERFWQFWKDIGLIGLQQQFGAHYGWAKPEPLSFSHARAVIPVMPGGSGALILQSPAPPPLSGPIGHIFEYSARSTEQIAEAALLVRDALQGMGLLTSLDGHSTLVGSTVQPHDSINPTIPPSTFSSLGKN